MDGGSSYDGGGAGGGYSGGSAYGNGRGASGGTSYINPTLCNEISRGYATVTDDGNRNLTNPWTAYGFVELELGRDENKYIIVKDTDGYKWFNGEDTIEGTVKTGFTNQWELIPNVTTEADLTEDIYKDYGNTLIINSNGLKDNSKFLVMSKEPDESITVSGNVNKAIIEQIKDVSISDVSELKSVTATTNLTNLNVKFAVSKNSGKTWQTYSAGNWVDINIKDRDEFSNNGYSLSQFNSIPVLDWNNYKAKTVKFAFIITQDGMNKNTIIDNIKIVADLVGSWRHFKESEAGYEYISDTELKVTFIEGGNYKVNYLDSLNQSTSN